MNSDVCSKHLRKILSRDAESVDRILSNSLYEIRPFKNDKRKIKEKDGKFIGLKKYEK